MREWVIRHAAAVRYAGLAGSVALGADAYLFGAKPVMSTLVTPQEVASGPHGVMIMVLWLAGTALLAGAWWAGRHLIGTVTMRWIVLTAALWMIPMLVIPPLESRDVYSYACQGALFAAGGDAYHQGVASMPCPWLSTVSHAWRDTPTPYGPLALAMSGLASKLGSLTAALAAFRAYAVAGVALIGVSLPPIARRVGASPERALWLVLACPLVAIHLIGGAHNDAVTIGLFMAGIALVVTRYGRLSTWLVGGALLGLSMAVKPTQIVVLPFIALYASGGRDVPRDRSGSPVGVGRLVGDVAVGRLGFPPVVDLVRRGGAVLLGAAVGLLIPTIATGAGFGWTSALINSDVEEAWTAPSTALGTTIDAFLRIFGVHVHVVDPVRTVFFVLFIASLVAAFWRARLDGRFYAAGLALLAISFFAPGVQPWYMIWPLALFAITGYAVRWFLIAIVVASFAAMPSGVGLDGLARLPLSVGNAIVAIAGLVACVRWLRGVQPRPLRDLDDHEVDSGKPQPVVETSVSA